MHIQPGQSLLTEADPSPVRIVNPGGGSPFLLIGDHAGNLVPAVLGTLGVSDADMRRHIAWDIGVADLGGRLAVSLDATFICQRYSRLVIDCNRHSEANDCMPAVSDGTIIPANQALTGSEREARVDAIYAPYQMAIALELVRREAEVRNTILIALHSFTPSMRGIARPWHIGILYGGGREDFARAMLDALSGRGDLIVGDNEPYAMDGTDYTIPLHAFASGRRYAEIEIRQDLLENRAQFDVWTETLACALAVANS